MSSEQKHSPKHSPLPWTLNRDADTAIEICSEDDPIAEIGIYGCEQRLIDLCNADAELIVQAVNNHEKLVEALKHVTQQLAMIGYPRNDEGDYDKDGEWFFGDALPKHLDEQHVFSAFMEASSVLASLERKEGYMRKKKAVKPEISHDSKRCNFNHHRADFQTCPHCGEKFDDDIWRLKAKTLVLGVVQGKHGYGAYLSECDKCFKLSWVHHNLDYFEYDFPKDWAQAAKKEWFRRHRIAIDDFSKSQCIKCKHLVGVDLKTADPIQCALNCCNFSQEQCSKFELYKESSQ